MIRRIAMMCGVCGALIFLLCGFNASVRPVMVEGRRCVNLADAAKANGWKLEYAPDGRSVTVSGVRFAVRLIHDSAAAYWSDVRLALLGKAVRLPDGNWVVGKEDLQHTLKPVLAPAPLPPTPVRRVVIDAGHGGHDPGAVRSGVLEKAVNMSLAERLVPLLEKQGLKVVLTRSGDQFVPLEGRADRVRLENGDIFLSIHQNAAGNPDASGTEIFFAPGSRFEAASMHLAMAIQFSIMKCSGGLQTPQDRGIKRAGFRVIRQADCPAVLLECGFLSNTEDRMKLMNEEYLNTFAEAVAIGILCYRSLLSPREEQGGNNTPEERENHDAN